MLESVLWQAGRKPYKRLLSISAREHADTYEALQNIRNSAVTVDMGIYETLGETFAALIRQRFSEKLDPLDLVFDIPPKRSPANETMIISTTFPHVGAATRLAEHATMWQEYGASFHDQARRIRLFCPEEVRTVLRKRLGSEGKLLALVEEAANRTARRVFQLELPMNHF
jgi:hypothetical protein